MESKIHQIKTRHYRQSLSPKKTSHQSYQGQKRRGRSVQQPIKAKQISSQFVFTVETTKRQLICQFVDHAKQQDSVQENSKHIKTSTSIFFNTKMQIHRHKQILFPQPSCVSQDKEGNEAEVNRLGKHEDICKTDSDKSDHKEDLMGQD